jgi:hypothetical protein
MFDINDVKLTGVVLSVDGGIEVKGPYANLYLESKGKKYTEILAISFYGDNADRIQKEVNKGDNILIGAKLIGKRSSSTESILLRLVGNFFFLLK